jgi:hypothetical protein
MEAQRTMTPTVMDWLRATGQLPHKEGQAEPGATRRQRRTPAARAALSGTGQVRPATPAQARPLTKPAIELHKHVTRTGRTGKSTDPTSVGPASAESGPPPVAQSRPSATKSKSPPALPSHPSAAEQETSRTLVA